MKTLTYEQALYRAAALCSGSEHSTTEVMEKLTKWGLSRDDAEKAIDYLIDEKYIDNERYCRAYCNDKFRYNHWGRIKIAQMLRLQHMNDKDIRQGMAVIDEDEYLTAIDEAIAQKARSVHDEDDYTRRGKIIRHLLSRGFETDLVLSRMDRFSD